MPGGERNVFLRLLGFLSRPSPETVKEARTCGKSGEHGGVKKNRGEGHQIRKGMSSTCQGVSTKKVPGADAQRAARGSSRLPGKREKKGGRKKGGKLEQERW